MKKNITSAVSTIYKLVSPLVKRKAKKISFFSFPDASDNSWHLYRHMAKRLEGHHFVWLTNEPPSTKLKNKINLVSKKNSNKVTIAKKNSLLGIYHFATSKHTFHTHGTYSFIRKKSDTTLINLWHGMPLKNIGLLDNKSPDDICYSDILVSTSPLFSKILSAAFGVSSEKIFHLGLPRNDVLAASANTDRKLIAEKFSFWEGNKFVAWLPTYRKSVIGDIRQDSKTSSFLDEWEPRILDEINQLAKAREIHLIIKLHPMDSLNREFEYEKFSNIHIFTSNSWEDLNLDLYDFLSVSSGLISDISSVLIDYQLTNRPIGITVNSITEYKRGIIEELNFEENFKSFKISKIDDFDIFFQACKSDINFEQGSVNYNKPIGSSACDSITTLLSIS